MNGRGGACFRRFPTVAITFLSIASSQEGIDLLRVALPREALVRTVAANIVADALVRLPLLVGALGAVGNPTAIASAVVTGLSDLVLTPVRSALQVRTKVGGRDFSPWVYRAPLQVCRHRLPAQQLWLHWGRWGCRRCPWCNGSRRQFSYPCHQRLALSLLTSRSVRASQTTVRLLARLTLMTTLKAPKGFQDPTRQRLRRLGRPCLAGC